MKTSSPDNPLITVKDLNVSFNTGATATHVLHDVSLTLHAGEILAIVGESGSGKSVMSKTFMGLLPAGIAHVTAGQLSLQGQDLLALRDGDWSRFRGSVISMIFQEPMSSLNPTKTCGSQVAEILALHTSLTAQEIHHRVLALFEDVKLPTPKITYHKYPHEISGGQMQRVMIAMAIACKPAVLIADEPTTALDVTVQREILLLLKELQATYGLSILFISHDLSLVQSLAHRVIVMYKGRIVEYDDAQEIFNNPKEQYTKALLAARPDVAKRLKRLPTIADFIDQNIASEEVTANHRAAHHKKIYAQQPVLELMNVVKEYAVKTGFFESRKVFTAVDDVSFKLYAGESLGLVGESGCGKSTLGSLILGLKKTTSGRILYNGSDLTAIKGSTMRALRKDLQIIFQDPFASLNPRLTVGQAIIEPMQWHGIGSNSANRKERVMQLLERVGLSRDHYNRYPHEFSGGQRQRVGIARAVALEPKLIVCDESVSALDISVQAQILNLLNDFKADFGFSYLFISHDLAVVKYFCDRVLVMHKGKIEEQNEADALFKNPESAYTKKLLEAVSIK